MASAALETLVSVNESSNSDKKNKPTIILKGRFTGNNYSQPLLSQYFIPNYDKAETIITIKWTSTQNTTWWAELYFQVSDPTVATLRGKNFPYDVSLTDFSQEGNYKTFRFDAESTLGFWAEVNIID